MKIRTLLGLVCTAVWIGAGTLVIWPMRSEFASMRPSEWGDFLAGFVAPLAFLWLILGYLQQGEDLRLQHEELRKQVEETAALVKQTRAQAEAAATMVELEQHHITSTRQKERTQVQHPCFSSWEAAHSLPRPTG